MKKALITGVTGQDGAYLLRLLLAKGYEVHAVKRRTSTFPTARIDDIYNDPAIEGHRFVAHYGDLHDGLGLTHIVRKVEPDEVYHLAAQSHVAVSFENPVASVLDNVAGTIHVLEAVRELGNQCRFYQASSSEMFGSSPPPQNETTPFHPRSPYGVAKVFAYWATVNYRESYNLFACNGILFNHESPRRGETFVTRKITRAVAYIKAGLQDKLFLGNLDAKRDWGYAREYVEAMWLMLQQDNPDDYVVATGETHSIREFCEIAFGHVGLDWQKYVAFDERYLRPAEVDILMGDAAKAKRVLGWAPKTTFIELVKLMVNADMKALQDQLAGVVARPSQRD